MTKEILSRLGAILVIAMTVLPAGCNNTYGPPPANGVPQNWGQQHYLDVQRQREQTERREKF